MEILKVSSKTEPKSLGGAIAGFVTKEGVAEMHAIGAGAVNAAVKGIAVARGFLAPTGIDLVCTPGFVMLTENEQERTAIRFVVTDRRGGK